MGYLSDFFSSRRYSKLLEVAEYLRRIVMLLEISIQLNIFESIQDRKCSIETFIKYLTEYITWKCVLSSAYLFSPSASV